MISLLPGVHIKPVSDKKEEEGINKDETAKNKEVKILSKTSDPMEVKPADSEEDSSTEEHTIANGDVDKDSDVSEESQEVDIPKSKETSENKREKSFYVEEDSDEEDNQIDMEDTCDTKENNVHHQTKSKEQVQTPVNLETTLVELCDHLVTTFFHGDSSMTTF